MWWIVIPVVVGAAAWILDEVSEEAKTEKDRWENKKNDVDQEVDQHIKGFLKHLEQAQNQYYSTLLDQRHIESARLSEQASKLLIDVQISLDALGAAIVKAKDQKDRLIEDRKRTHNLSHIKKLTTEIDSLIALRKQLFSQRDQMLSQKKTLNQKMRFLKN